MKKTKSYKVNHFTGLHRHMHHLPSLFMPSLMPVSENSLDFLFTSLLHIIHIHSLGRMKYLLSVKGDDAIRISVHANSPFRLTARNFDYFVTSQFFAFAHRQ